MKKTLYMSNKLVIDKLNQVDNQSKYVEGLILDDILRNGSQTDYKKTVENTIESIFIQIETIRKLLDKK